MFKYPMPTEEQEEKLSQEMQFLLGEIRKDGMEKCYKEEINESNRRKGILIINSKEDIKIVKDT